MKKIKQVFMQFFYIPKHNKISDKVFHRVILTSVFGMLMCAICLAGLTWAWFSDSTSGTAEALNTSKFGIDAEITVAGTEGSSAPIYADDDGVYSLDGGKTYTVNLTATGDASTGYCVVTLNGVDYYTTQMVPGSYLTFTINCTDLTDAASLVITPKWMTYSGYSADAVDLIGKNVSEITATAAVSGNAVNMMAALLNDPSANEGIADDQPDIKYVIKFGDTLSEIAMNYGISAEKLAKYNGIDDPDDIKAGDVIMIPVGDDAADTSSDTVDETIVDTTDETTDESDGVDGGE